MISFWTPYFEYGSVNKAKNVRNISSNWCLSLALEAGTLGNMDRQNRLKIPCGSDVINFEDMGTVGRRSRSMRSEICDADSARIKYTFQKHLVMSLRSAGAEWETPFLTSGKLYMESEGYFPSWAVLFNKCPWKITPARWVMRSVFDSSWDTIFNILTASFFRMNAPFPRMKLSTSIASKSPARRTLAMS